MNLIVLITLSVLGHCKAKDIFLNPGLPFLVQLTDILRPGTVIFIWGSTSLATESIHVDLQSGQNIQQRDNVALHVTLDYNYQVMIRGSIQNQQWNDCEFHGSSIRLNKGADFHLVILCDVDNYKIAFNGVYYATRAHKMPFVIVKYLSINGNLKLNEVRVTEYLFPFGIEENWLEIIGLAAHNKYNGQYQQLLMSQNNHNHYSGTSYGNTPVFGQTGYISTAGHNMATTGNSVYTPTSSSSTYPHSTYFHSIYPSPTYSHSTYTNPTYQLYQPSINPVYGHPDYHPSYQFNMQDYSTGLTQNTPHQQFNGTHGTPLNFIMKPKLAFEALKNSIKYKGIKC